MFHRFSFSHEVDNIKTVSQNRINIKSFSKVHKDLCEAFDLLNSLFTFHLIPIVIITLVIEIFAAYGALNEFMTPSLHTRFILLSNLSWLMIPLIMQITIAVFGSLLSKKAKTTSIIISDILQELDLEIDVAMKLQNFLVRNQCRNFDVHNDFFNADWKLLIGVRITNNFLNFNLIIFHFNRHHQRSLLIC